MTYNAQHVDEFTTLLRTTFSETESTKLINNFVEGLVDDMSLSEFYKHISNKYSTYIGKYEEFDDISSLYLLKSLMINIDINDYSSLIPKFKQIGIISNQYIQYCENNIDFINNLLDFKRDKLIKYFGLKTLIGGYLLKDVYGNVIETPQHMFLREAIQLNFNTFNNDDIAKTYDVLSNLYYTHATPTLINSGALVPQLSSCFLMQCGDDIKLITKSWDRISQISKWGGGIGINLSDVRGNGALIKSNGGHSEGILKLCKVLEAISIYVNQCFSKKTQVYTLSGLKTIENITTDDRVLTIDGTYKQVINVKKTYIEEEIVSITIPFSFETIKVTKNHEIYVKINDEIKYIEAKDINRETKLCLVIPDINEKEIINIGYEEDIIKLLGYIYGSGNYDIESQICAIVMSENDKCLFEDFFDTVMKKYNYENSKIGSLYYIHNVGDWINLIFDGSNKKMSQSIKHMDKNMTNHFIDGVFKTSLKHERNIKMMTSVSFDNFDDANDLSELLLKVGRYRECVYEDNQKYTFAYYDEYVEIIGNKMFYSIDEINNYTYKGNVYDLTVEDNHNYVTNLGLVHNCGKRDGAIAVYLEPWHNDVEMFLDLKRLSGNEHERTRKLNIALWIPDLFMECVMNDKEWYLMTPDISVGLTDVYGEEFNILYKKYIDEGKYTKVVRARDIYLKIQESQFESGMPYMLFKDACNRKNNQKNLGTIKCGNLCAEIIQYSSDEEIATCNLASISLTKFVNNDKTFNYEKLGEISRIAVKNLNNVIDVNYYPVEESRLSNMRHRAVGLGVQGLADVYQMMGYAFDSNEAMLLNKKIFECIYYYSLLESMELAKINGPYSSFEGSPFSQGILQFHMCGKTIEDLNIEGYPSFAWEELIENIKIYGTRNSMITSQMPTSKTSQMMGNYECCEPYNTNLFMRATGEKEFIVVNKHLIRDLKERGLWNNDLYQKIIYYGGSVQKIDEIDDNLKSIYKTSFELQQKYIVLQSIDRGMFIDQTQSMNLFFEECDYLRLERAHFFGWKHGLKTGIYYLRGVPASRSAKIGVGKDLLKKEEECANCSA